MRCQFLKLDCRNWFYYASKPGDSILSIGNEVGRSVLVSTDNMESTLSPRSLHMCEGICFIGICVFTCLVFKYSGEHDQSRFLRNLNHIVLRMRGVAMRADRRHNAQWKYMAEVQSTLQIHHSGHENWRPQHWMSLSRLNRIPSYCAKLVGSSLWKVCMMLEDPTYTLLMCLFWFVTVNMIIVLDS